MGSVELAILKVAQEAGYVEQIPDSEEEIREEALYFVSEAKDAIQQSKFKKDKTVKAIVELGKQLESAQNRQEEGKDIFGAPEVASYKGLPIPEDPKRDPASLPDDFTGLSPKEVMKLHAQYNAYYGRARWLLAIATNKLAGATHLRDAEYRKSYRRIFEDTESKKLTQPQLEAAAKSTEEYQRLDETVRVFQEDVTTYKALTEIYLGNVERLSREWTMRQDEDKAGR